MNYMNKLAGALILAEFLSGGVLVAGERRPMTPDTVRPEGMYSVSEEVVTAHTAWAKPYAGKAPAILFIVPRWTAREVVEVAQRLTMDYAVVMTDGSATYCYDTNETVALNGGAEYPRQTTQRLTNALARAWDVIVMGNVQLSILPNVAREQLTAKVKEGAGLLVTGNAKDALFTNLVAGAPSVPLPETLQTSIPYRDLPAFAQPETLPAYTACRLGKGLVVTARYVPGDFNVAISPDFTVAQKHAFPAIYDYYQALVIKALLFAANRLEDNNRIVSVTVPAQAVDRTAVSSVKLTVATKAGEQARHVRLRIRDGQEKEYFTKQQASATEVVFEAPTAALPAGRYFADAWLLDSQDRVLDWFTTAFDITDPQGIVSMEPAKPFVPVGQGMDVRLTLRQPLGQNERIEVSAFDHFKRLAYRGTLLGAGQTQFVAHVLTVNVLSSMATVRASIERAGRVVAGKTIEFPVVQPAGQGPGWDDFSYMVWNYNGSGPADELYRRLSETGMDQLMTAPTSIDDQAGQSALIAARYNCRPFACAGYIHSVQTGTEFYRKHLEDATRALSPYGSDSYNMGDENQLGQSSENSDPPLNDPEINTRFREYLKKQYPALDALNAEWNTAFTNWGDVNGIMLAEATNRHQEARWVDHRMHRETLFAALHSAGQDGAAVANPFARAGFEGIFQTESYRGYDWSKLCAGMKLFGCYWFNPAEYEFIASMKRPGSYWGFWNGGYPGVINEHTQRWCAWRCLHHGMNSVWFWVPYWSAAAGNPLPLFSPDLRENPAYTPFMESVREIKSGIGKLVLTAERTQAPIAIHYSQASIHSCTLDAGGFATVGAGQDTRMHSAWMTAAWSLKEAGIQPRFVPYNEIERGALKDHRVLILPFSQAISTQEVTQIRAFVEAGGVLVADVRPGLRDGHGKLQPKGLLDDLFGIAWQWADKSDRSDPSYRPAAPTNVVLDLTLAGRSLKGVLPFAQPDPAVRVTTGKALAKAGEVPIFIENRVGKGSTLLLNFAGNYAPGSYMTTVAPEIHTVAAGDLYREIALACAALGGVQPEITATVGDQPLRGIDIVTWKNGSAAYYGFTPNDFCDFAWVMTMPDLAIQGKTAEPGFFYDIRSGRFLGESHSFKATLPASSALLIARLPYRVDAVQVTGPKTAVPGERVILPLEVIPRQGVVGNHVLRVEVTVDGKSLPHYSANVKADGGAAAFILPLALNDPAGKWTVTARDVATGVSGSWQFRVK